MRDAGLPVPSANAFVAGFQLDMYCERERFAVELDGFEFHRDRAALLEQRRNELLSGRSTAGTG